jgi:hypothetical protein
MTLSTNLFERLNEVRKKVAYVKKDANIDNRYMAVSHDMVTALIREHLIEQEIFIIPSLKSSKMEEARKTKNGAPVYRYEATYKISVCAAGCPETVEMDIEAHADDSGDKAPGKCLSYAVKSAMLKLFSLETGVNDESRLGEGKRVMEHLKDEVTEYLECNDALAIYLLSQSVGEDIWGDLYNSAPDGKKVSFKKSLSEAEKTGIAVLQEINEAITTGDDLKAKENVQDLTDGGKRLLARHLGHERAAALGKLTKGEK